MVFTDLSKYDGYGRRLLRPHEYTQMAGRAGRRGIDTVGKIWICANMIKTQPTPNEMSHILTGPPQTLTSQFKISYPLAIAAAGQSSNNSLNDIIIGSMLEKNMKTTADLYKNDAEKLIPKLMKQQSF